MKKSIFCIFMILAFILPVNVKASNIELKQCIEISHCVIEEINVQNLKDPFLKAKAIVNQIPRTKIVELNADYIHAEVTSRIMKYVDDLEISYSRDKNKIFIRSESRVGEGDFGVNKKRVKLFKNNLFK